LGTNTQDPSPSARVHSLPCLETFYINDFDNLPGFRDLPSSLQSLALFNCPKVQFLSGKLDALTCLAISGCETLRSLESCLGDLPSLTTLMIERCKSLTSLPDGPRAYSSLESLEIKYCPAMKSLPGCLKQRLDSVEEKLLSHMRSSDPREGTSWFFPFICKLSLVYQCPDRKLQIGVLLKDEIFSLHVLVYACISSKKKRVAYSNIWHKIFKHELNKLLQQQIRVHGYQGVCTWHIMKFSFLFPAIMPSFSLATTANLVHCIRTWYHIIIGSMGYGNHSSYQELVH
jgi:hypothetical protein